MSAAQRMEFIQNLLDNGVISPDQIDALMGYFIRTSVVKRELCKVSLP